MTTLAVPGVAYARANWGRWVVECVRRFCRDALTLPPGTAGMICPTCGTSVDIAWPADVAVIEEILSARPDPTTRNWEPGEPVWRLLMENLAHGISPVSTPEVGASASRLVLDTSGDDMRVVLLDEPAVLDANPALAIGA